MTDWRDEARKRLETSNLAPEEQEVFSKAMMRSALAELDQADARIAELVAALKSAVVIADEAAREWDASPNGMRAGKILLALCGRLKGYRADITAIHDAIAKAEGKP